MKKLIFALILSSLFVTEAFSQIDCGTPSPSEPYIFKESVQDSINGIMAINTPYCVRTYITVFADDNGANLAASNDDVLRQFQNMVDQYDAHNICFMLVDVKQVNNTDLNNHNKTEVLELDQFKVDDCLNIFIHNSLRGTNTDGTTYSLNGTAYAIPNTFLSLVGSTLASVTNLTVLGHETGHCFGLYHTFTTFSGTRPENVTRNSASGCYDCLTDGDVLCDTPADDDGGQAANCAYTGGGTDACGVTYTPATNNIMGYGNRPCRSIMTAGQGNRMRSMLIDNADLNDLVNDDDGYIPSVANSTINFFNTQRVFTARDNLYISNYSNSSFNAYGATDMYLQAKKVRLKPGTHLYPSTGRVYIKSNTYCD